MNIVETVLELVDLFPDFFDSDKAYHSRTGIIPAVLAILAVVLFYMFYLSHQTEQFDVSDIDSSIMLSGGISDANGSTPTDLIGEEPIKQGSMGQIPAGYITILMNTEMIQRELDSPAGWVVNDKILPTQFLDNNRNFQLGIREVCLRTVQMIRENLSRQDRTNSPINEDVDKAYGYISVRAESWIFPSYESQLKHSIDSLNDYSEKLMDGKAGFYPRADTMVKVLENYASLLGSVSTKLSSDDINWFNQDDRFYYAKGVVYAMYENLLAMRIDFERVLSDNDGKKIMESIINDIQSSYFEPFVVITGDIDSWRNNHLDRIARKILSTRQKMNSLSSVLLHRGSPSGG